MPVPPSLLTENRPLVVGSFGNSSSIPETSLTAAEKASDILEIRLDILVADGVRPTPALWAHLKGMPILFTARRKEEGSPIDLGPDERMALLEIALEDAAMIDVEVASIGEMGAIIDKAKLRNVPWVASYHDFGKLPATQELEEAARLAKEAGADVFKAAAKMNEPADIARLAEFQKADHGIRLATMGMGKMAAVSRLLCAQCGSALNYGYIGDTPTAPGQWSAGFLREAMRLLSI